VLCLSNQNLLTLTRSGITVKRRGMTRAPHDVCGLACRGRCRNRRGVGRPTLELCAGAFLIFLPSFKVGDAVTAGGVTGTVEAIGLFGHDDQHTRQRADDRRKWPIFSHPELFGQPISSRGSDCHDQQRRGPHQAIRLLKDRLARIPNVLSAPAPDVDIVQFTPAGPLLCVRPYCNHQHYWQVYFETIA
jgi:small conductance mechanosensitive channel